MAGRRWNLRGELLIEARPDGGVALLDPLFERVEQLGPAEVAALDAGDEAALARLDARHLREGPVADAVRAAAWSARLRPEPLAPGGPDAAPPPALLQAVAALGWGAAWRAPERWRRLVEAGRAGNTLLPLDGLLDPDEAAAIAAQARALPRALLRSAVVEAERAAVDPAVGGALGALRERLAAPATRGVLGLALGRELGERLHLNVWSLAPGQRMAVHQDGAGYAATFALGLNVGWRGADGGAIAFGEPGPGGLGVIQRWLPQLGDALVFAPTATRWHAVEPPTRARLTLSGWWLR